MGNPAWGLGYRVGYEKGVADAVKAAKASSRSNGLASVAGAVLPALVLAVPTVLSLRKERLAAKRARDAAATSSEAPTVE